MVKTILISSALYAPHVGGVEKYTESLSHQLAAMGNKVYVVTHQLSEEQPILENDGDVTIVRLPCKGYMDFRFPVPLRNKRYLSQLEWLSDLPLDAIVVNTRFYLLSHEMCLMAKDKGIRPIIIEHGSAHLTAGNMLADMAISPVEHALTQRIKAVPADYYGVSIACNRWLTHFGIDAKGVIPNAIDAEEFRMCKSNRDFRAELNIINDDFIVCFIGRYNIEKGVSKLLDASRIIGSNDNIHFVFAGDGPMKEVIAGSRLSYVHDVGPLCKEDISALLQASDAFCLPSRSEGFSTALLEAAACGTPPIITTVGGVDELIPSKKYGYVLKKASPHRLAKQIKALSRNRKKCRSIGSSLMDRTEKLCTWNSSAQKIIEAIDSASCSQTSLNTEVGTKHG